MWADTLCGCNLEAVLAAAAAAAAAQELIIVLLSTTSLMNHYKKLMYEYLQIPSLLCQTVNHGKLILEMELL